MKITTSILGLAAMGLAIAACAPESTPAETDEDISSEGDALKIELCLSDANCDEGSYCDHTECLSNCPEGQMCPAVCYGQCLPEPEPPVELCLTDASCDEGSYCDHTECLSNCPEGQICPAVCYGQCLPETASNPECGGFAGLPCPKGLECVDKPGDDCDPANGGADCGGICVDPQYGEKCGDNVCGAGTYCCNASCGVCAPEGWYCTQQVCDSVE